MEPTVPPSNSLNLGIIHISSSHSGGAGIAARRLHNSLCAIGIDSTFLTLDSRGFFPGPQDKVIVRSLLRKISSIVYTKLAKAIFGKTYFTLFSAQALSLKNIESLGKPENTIIHVHNWFNLLNLTTLRKILQAGYRVVFTLHDQRIFTGGCHYSLGCQKYMQTCSRCPELPNILNGIPELNLMRTLKLFRKYNSQISCVAPSLWLKTAAQSSQVLKFTKIFQVGNVHELPWDNFENKLFRDSRKVTLGIASMDKFSYLKGFDNVNDLEDFLTFNQFPYEVKYLSNYLKDGFGSRVFWEDIDFLLVLSNADNSPNVIHEAKIHGVRVIGSDVGGIPELLNPEYDLCTAIDSEMPRRIMDFLITSGKSEFTGLRARIFNEYRDRNSRFFGEYMSIYQEIEAELRLNSK